MFVCTDPTTSSSSEYVNVRPRGNRDLRRPMDKIQG
jgi:hypothetical protein